MTVKGTDAGTVFCFLCDNCLRPPDRPRISRIPGGRPFNPKKDAGPGSQVLQPVQPFGKVFRPANLKNPELQPIGQSRLMPVMK